MSERARPARLLIALMLAAYALRLVLISGGGQLYHPDELRYYRSIEVAKHVYNGDFKNAIKGLFRNENHGGIASAKLVPALFHRLVHNISHDDNLMWRDIWRTTEQNFWLPSLLFALPSVCAIGLIYLVQRGLGADEFESLLSALLLATSNAMFIYSKHLLPYDIAIFIGLFTVYLAVRCRANRFLCSLCIGLLTFVIFWVYNGYVTLAMSIAFLYCAVMARTAKEALLRAIGIATGAALLFGSHVAFNIYFLQIDVLQEMFVFSTTIQDGEFSEGIVFPFRYFFDVEGVIGAVWLVGILLAVLRIRSQPQTDDRRRAKLWLAAIVVLYLLLVLFSAGLERFVVYGRVARALAPFIVLLCAYGLAPKLAKAGRKARALFVAALCIVAISNFLPVIRQRYPLEFSREVYHDYDDVSFETTVPIRFDHWELQPRVPKARYRLIDAAYYNTVPLELGSRPPGDEIEAFQHPIMYKPWQYEGATQAMRELINREGIYIRLVDTEVADEA